MSREISSPSGEQKKSKWPLKTLIEILPIIIALTALFSYSSIKKVADVSLVTPLQEVLGGVPLWVAGLMGLILLVGFLGMSWLIYIFSRAPIAPDGSANDEQTDEQAGNEQAGK